MAALLVTAAASAAANVLVVRASGPSAKTYPPGRSLPDNARINLRAGDSLVVLDARGTRTFRGPGVFSPATAARAGTRTVETAGGRRARIGAVRSAGIVPTASPANIWQVDVSQSSTTCLTSTSNVTLWRAESSQPTTLIITGPRGVTRNVPWPAGRATLAWPADLPITDDFEYQLRHGAGAVPSRIQFKTLQSEPADMQAVAEALIQAGCQEQLDLLVESVPSQ